MVCKAHVGTHIAKQLQSQTQQDVCSQCILLFSHCHCFFTFHFAVLAVAEPDTARFFVTLHHNKQDFFHSAVFVIVQYFILISCLALFPFMVSQQETEKWQHGQ